MAKTYYVFEDSKAYYVFEDSKQLSNHIAGYVAHNFQSLYEGCCDDELKYQDNNKSCSKYLKTLSRGGLKIPSNWLKDFVNH